MAVMTLDQVKAAREKAYGLLQAKGYDPALAIESKAQLIEVARDIFEGIHQRENGAYNLHVHDGTGGMFIALLERIKSDDLRQEIITEVNEPDTDPKRLQGARNRFPGKITAGSASLLVLRSDCTTRDIRTLGRIRTDTNNKFKNPAALPDFMRNPQSRGLFLGSRVAFSLPENGN